MIETKYLHLELDLYIFSQGIWSCLPINASASTLLLHLFIDGEDWLRPYQLK